ncbi:MAG: hypothetical protein ABI832_14535 [bacterium]
MRKTDQSATGGGHDAKGDRGEGERLDDKGALIGKLDEAKAEAALLRAHIALLQDSLSQALMVRPTASVRRDPGVPAVATLQWENTLAKALAAARLEAVRRAALEGELDALKREVQEQARLEQDVKRAGKLFAQVAQESTAALDEIARLTALVAKAGQGPAASPED